MGVPAGAARPNCATSVRAAEAGPRCAGREWVMATQWSRKELSQMPRAWKVSSLDEERADIVYARNPFEAAREGACALDLCADEVTVERDPDFDHLRGRSLWQAQLEDGWWFGCHAPRCERRVSLE